MVCISSIHTLCWIPTEVLLSYRDTPFWSQRMKEQTLKFDEEAVRPYFPLPHVLNGLFSLAERLYGIILFLSVSN
jgi:Zn-dependent oligopeptidase